MFSSSNANTERERKKKPHTCLGFKYSRDNTRWSAITEAGKINAHPALGHRLGHVLPAQRARCCPERRKQDVPFCCPCWAQRSLSAATARHGGLALPSSPVLLEFSNLAHFYLYTKKDKFKKYWHSLEKNQSDLEVQTVSGTNTYSSKFIHRNMYLNRNTG